MKLAEEGMLFRNAYCAAPSCSPSRAALFTGMSPHSCGMMGLAHRGFELKDYNKHLVRFLNRYGYDTVLSGFQHEAPDNKMIGYKKILQDEEAPEQISGEGFIQWDLDNARKAADYIKQAENRPYFLSFGMMNTHRPFPKIDQQINPNYVMPPFPIFDHQDNREDTAAFMTSVKVVDQCVGIILDAVIETGREEDTMIIFTTDHGAAFPRMKCSLYDTGIGVSLIMKFPGNHQKGQSLDGLVSQLDIFPTLCDLSGFEKPDWLQGRSMLPLFENKAEHIRDEIFSEATFHKAYEPIRCVRTERYKFIKYFEDKQQIVHIGGDEGISEKFVEAHGIYDEMRSNELLFDLYLDPLERVSLMNDNKYKDVYEDLSNRLENWMKVTDDPLLSGSIEPPPGAKLSKPSGIGARASI